MKGIFMKPKSLTLLAVTLSIFAIDAPRINAGPTWAQSFGATSQYNDGTVEPSIFYGPGSDVPIGIAKMPDGGVVVAGQLNLPERAAAALVRYAADGTILWQKMLRPDDS